HSPTDILMQREDVILEWIFLPCKPNKKLKTYIGKISDLIHKDAELQISQASSVPPLTASGESANQDLQKKLLNLDSANLIQELQSINNKCIAKIDFVDNKYEYLMDRTLTLQSEVVTTQTQCKEERLSLIDKIRSLESCVSEEHNRWYDSMKNLESQAREEVHSLEQTLCARLQALEETLCKHDKEPNKQKGILMQREDVILEWIFLPRKPNKKLKTYIEKISDLIHKGKLRLRQLTGMDPAEIVVPLTNEEVSSLWKDNEYWQRACSNFLGDINNRYPKSKKIEFIKKTEWVLPHIVRQKPISGVLTFYTDANKLGKAGYKSGDLSKVVQSPYNSVQKAELYAILMVLMDFTEPLNIVTDSQYTERVVLHIETAEFIPDNTELTSLFIQLQEIIRNREHPIYITHIRSHTELPGPLAQGNDEIDQLLIGNVLEASEFHKKHHVNSKGLKKDFAITWQQAKDIVKKFPTCSIYNQTPLPAGSNPKGIQRNEIWQMDVFHFAEFGRLKYVHHTIDTYSGFQWATPMSSEKADSVIIHLLEVMAIMGIPVQIKTDNAPAYVSNKMRQFFAYYNIRHVTGIPHNPTGQAVIERSNQTLKDMLNKQQQVTMTPRNRLHSALLTLNFLNADEKGTTAAERHWTTDKTSELNQPVYFKDVLSSEWKPGYVLRWGRGFAFVSAGEEKLWIPTKLIKIRFEQEKPFDKEK
ncbi:hypothetical protein STEG23_006054, partial [Scotinomys teguina]